MNEQQQAELLAAWLEDPIGPPPEGLDVDLVEGIVALRPEVAPAPRVSIDDILAGVTTGPLANPMPAGASLAVPPEQAPEAGSSERRRPWWIAAVGVGGFGSLVAAAAVVLVIGGTVLSTADLSRSEPLQSVSDAPAARPAARSVDTGLSGAKGSNRVAKQAVPRPSPRAPSPAPRAQDAEAEPDAVALSEDFYDEPLADPSSGDLDASRLRSPIPEIPEALAKPVARSDEKAKDAPSDAAGSAAPERESVAQDRSEADGIASSGAGAGPAPAPRPSAPVASRPAPAAAPIPEAPRAPMRRPEASPPPPPAVEMAPMDDAAVADEEPSFAEESKSDSRRKEKRERSLGMKKTSDAPAAPGAELEEERQYSTTPDAQEEVSISFGRDVPVEGGASSSGRTSDVASGVATPTAPPTGGLGNLSAQARSGVGSATSPEIERAVAALQAGNTRDALAQAEAGLAVHSGNTPVRQRLLVLKGDALVQLGDLPRAQAAYQQAVELAAAR
ncbi:MAG: hypothetical protein R3F61_11775 [Myxococcota bacterium]